MKATDKIEQNKKKKKENTRTHTHSFVVNDKEKRSRKNVLNDNERNKINGEK